jgi:hypothetical protein
VVLSAPIVFECASGGHGLVDGWPIKVHCAKGLQPVEEAECAGLLDPCKWYRATYIDDNHFSLPIAGACLTPYVSGGVIEYYSPGDLSAASARMQIRADIDDALPLIELSTTNGRIAIDAALARITRLLSAIDTAALPGDGGVYDLEVVQGSNVLRMDEGKVSFRNEVTR